MAISNLAICHWFFKRMFVFEGTGKDSDLITFPPETSVKHNNIISYCIFCFASVKPTTTHYSVASNPRFHSWGGSSEVQCLSSKLSAWTLIPFDANTGTMSSSNTFQKIHFDFAPCHLQTKAPLAWKVKPSGGEGHLHPVLTILCERALHEPLLREAEGRWISNLKNKAVFSQSVIISLILLWKPCQIPPPRLIYGSIRIPGSRVLSLLGVQKEPALTPSSVPSLLNICIPAP